MKKIIKYIIICMILILFFILGFSKKIYNVDAASTINPGKTTFWDILGMSYDNVKVGWGASYFEYARYKNGTYQALWYPYNFRCNGICLAADENSDTIFYDSNSENTNNYNEVEDNRFVKLHSIINIDVDGTVSILEGENDKYKDVTTISKEDGLFLAALCYWATSDGSYNESNGAITSKYLNQTIYNDTKFFSEHDDSYRKFLYEHQSAFRYWLSKNMQKLYAKNSFNLKLYEYEYKDGKWQDSNIKNLKNYKFADNYMKYKTGKSYTKGELTNVITDYENYDFVGKVYIFSTSGCQPAAALYGKKVEKKSELSIKKYITKVDSTEYYDRDKLLEGDKNGGKKNKAVGVRKGEVVEYTIKIENKGNGIAKNIEFKDEYNIEGKCFQYESDTLDGANRVGNTKTITDNCIKFKIDKIEAGKTVIIKIRLKIIDDAKVNYKYENRATVKIENSSFSSSDYIYIKQANISIDKHIIEVGEVKNGKKIPQKTYSRANKSDAYKRENAVVVLPGYYVTYEIIIKNNGNVKAENIQFYDEFDRVVFKRDENHVNIEIVEGNIVEGNINILQNGSIMTGSIGCINEGACVKLKITLQLISNFNAMNGKRYLNRAEYEYEGVEKSSYDYIEIESPELSIKKYITKRESDIDSEQISGRDKKFDSEKSIYPVKVGLGNTITYRIEISNTGNAPAKDVAVEDWYNYEAFRTIKKEDISNLEVNGSSVDTTDWIKALNIKEKHKESYGFFTANISEIPANSIVTFEVKLKVKSKQILNDKTWENRVRCSIQIENYDSTYTRWAYDFIKITPITINKYVSKVEYPTDFQFSNSSIYTSQRKNISNDEKGIYPVVVVPGTKVTYTIDVTSGVASKFDIYDVADNNLIYINSGWNKVGNTSNTYCTQYSGTSQSFEITFKVDSEINYGKTKESTTITYGNNAYIINTEKTNKNKSSDWIRLKYEDNPYNKYSIDGLKYTKYIVEVNDIPLTPDRSGYNNTKALNNPVTLKQGDKVTYRLEITNASENVADADKSDDFEWGSLLKNIEIEDTWDNGLELLTNNSRITKSGNSFKFKFSSIDIKATNYIDIDFKVTKSDMYLYLLENKFQIKSGQYEKITRTYHPITFTITTGTEKNGKPITTTETWTSDRVDESKKDTDINLSNCTAYGNNDYIQLDDVEIAGEIWIDSNKNGVKDTNEKLVTSSIKVYLLDNNNNVLNEKVTTNGKYSFGKVAKGNIPYGKANSTRKYADNSGYNQYYVEFKYFGVQYESTKYTDETDVLNLKTINNWNKKSHARESNVSEVNRNDYNKNFETIAYNRAYSGKNGLIVPPDKYWPLDYTFNSTTHESKLNVNQEPTISSRSIGLFVERKEGDTDMADDVEYLKHINLGLINRSSADLEMTKDVVEAKVSVNGFETIYTYEKLGSGDYTVANYNKIKKPYELKIYNEDYNFRTNKYSSEIQEIKGTDNDLKVELKYKLTVCNKSLSGEYAVVREIVDYSSDEMELKRVEAEDGSELEYSDNSSYNDKGKYKYNGYETKFIIGNLLSKSIPSGESINLYLTYMLKKDEENPIYIDKSPNDLGKINIAGISAFSIYADANQTVPLGLVDKDSNPGSINKDNVNDISDTTYYEDDTFQTSILIKLKGEDSGRTITGTVWEDKSANPLSNGQIVGNGKRDASEQGIKNITVCLLEVVTNKAGEQYLIDSGITTKTNLDGKYTIKNSDRLHAGQYIVRFIYGNDKDSLYTENNGKTIKYSGQDYKSTTYIEPSSKELEEEVLESDAFSAKSPEQILSFAKDNEIRRLEVIDYSTTMKHEEDEILKGESGESLEELANNTAMYADTKMFNIQVEYKEYYSNFEEKMIDGVSKKEYKITSINFGIVERPITKLVLMNDIKEIQATLSDGRELVHLYFNIKYEKDENGIIKHKTELDTINSKGQENVQVLNRTNNSQGFRYVNVDTDILQGMEIKLKFQIAVINNSDIDTSSEELINLVKEGTLREKVLDKIVLNDCLKYDGGSQINNAFLKNSLYYTVNKKMNEEIGKPYEIGKYLGKTYYTGEFYENTKIVETRVDQIVNYLDPYLIYNSADNDNKLIPYSIDSIAENKLLKNVTTKTKEIIDGKSNYINNQTGESNVLFSMENGDVNETFYKYLTPYVKNEDIDDHLYIIDFEASRLMTSELDINGMLVDNLAEIVKVSNTVGRKVYIKKDGSKETGFIGNSLVPVDEDGDEMKNITSNDEIKIVSTRASTGSVEASKEADTDYTEQTTFSPPTGLTVEQIKQEKTINKTLIICLSIIVVMGTGYVMFKVMIRKKFYK